MAGEIAKLFARIGLKVDQGKLNNFEKGLKSARTGLIAATAKAAILATAIKLIADNAYDAARALKQFEVETGSSAQELQKWQAVADQTNNSAKSVTAAVKSIADNQSKIRLGAGNISGYQLLGIDPRQDPFKILEELRVKTKGLSQSMKKNVLSQMGINAELMQVLALTNDEFDSMAKRAYILPTSAINSIDKARKSSRLLIQSLNHMKNMFIAKLSPGIIKFNKILTRIIDLTYSFIDNIDSLVSNTIGWEKATYGLLTVIALLNAKLIMSPIGLFAASIIALLLILEDLYVYSQGGKSLFGHLMKKFPEFEEKVSTFIDIMSELKELLSGFWSGKISDEMDKILEKWGLFGGMIKGVADSIKFLTGQWDKIDTRESGFQKTAFYKGLTDFVGKMFVGIEKGPAMAGNNNNYNYNIKQEINSNNANADDVATSVDKKLQESINSASSQRVRNE